jgi:hypothetical protein
MRNLLYFLALLPLVGGIDKVDKGELITVHVKEVHRTQDEGTEKGTWLHITAIAESRTIIYSIKCDEYLSVEKHDFIVRCFQISAGKDYPARKFVRSINFWPDGEKGDGYSLSLYEIADEKEK